MSLFEYWPIAAAVFFLGQFAHRLGILLHAPSWVGYSVLGGTLAVACVIASWRGRIDDRRKAREDEEDRIAIEDERERVQAHYPHCHATRLKSGEWFLTDRATGREYQPERQ